MEKARPVRRKALPSAGILMLLAGALFSLFGAEASAQVKWKGTIVKEGDVTVVKNPKEPLYKTPILELEEELSLGGAEAEDEYAFVRIRHVVVDDAGTIYVLDQRAAHVKVFDASGAYLRTIGRKGQGPGELEYPMTLSLNRTTDELAVTQQSRGIAFFRADGTFLRNLSLRGMLAARGRVDGKGNIYITELASGADGMSYETKKLGPDAAVLATLASSPTPSRGGKRNPFQAISHFLVDRADHLVFGHPETYEIRFYAPEEPKVFKKITKEYDPMAVTAEERAEQERDVPPGMKIDFDFSKYHSAYYRFFTSDLGYLFVQTWEKTEDGKSIHDIFDAEGRFIGRIPLKPTGIEILKGKYYALEEDEEGYQTVKRYAMTWTIK